jgi:hypothetical protein
LSAKLSEVGSAMFLFYRQETIGSGTLSYQACAEKSHLVSKRAAFTLSLSGSMLHCTAYFITRSLLKTLLEHILVIFSREKGYANIKTLNIYCQNF